MSKVKLSIDKGATFRFGFHWHDGKNNSLIPDATFQSHFREDISSEIVLLNLTSENGGFQVGTLNEKPIAYLHLTHEQTSAFPLESAVFDIEATLANGERKRLFSGTAKFTPEVTR